MQCSANLDWQGTITIRCARASAGCVQQFELRCGLIATHTLFTAFVHNQYLPCPTVAVMREAHCL